MPTCQNVEASPSPESKLKFASLSKTKNHPFEFYERSQPRTDISYKKI